MLNTPMLHYSLLKESIMLYNYLANPKKPPVQTFFCLQPLKILEIQIKFKAPSPQNAQDWPMIIKKEAQGEILAHFINGDQ